MSVCAMFSEMTNSLVALTFIKPEGISQIGIKINDSSYVIKKVQTEYLIKRIYLFIYLFVCLFVYCLFVCLIVCCLFINSSINVEFIFNEGKKCFILTTHSTHFLYGYMASDILQEATQQYRKPAAATTWATLSD